ncbi:isopentenyl pyrophosphate isomerase, partial [Acetobacter tropicalis]
GGWEAGRLGGWEAGRLGGYSKGAVPSNARDFWG